MPVPLAVARWTRKPENSCTANSHRTGPDRDPGPDSVWPGTERGRVPHSRCSSVQTPAPFRGPGEDRCPQRPAAGPLPKLGEITGARIPSIVQEAARDLIRAREDCRADPCVPGYRISKLLLRQGIIYSGRQAWTGLHEIWLNRQHFSEPARELTYRSCLAGMRAIDERRHDLDAAITGMALDSEYTAVVQCLGCLRSVSTSPPWTGRGNRRLGAVHRLQHRRLPWPGSFRAFLRGVPVPRVDHQDRQHPCPQAAGRSVLASPPALPESLPAHAGPVETGTRRGTGPRTCREPAAASTLAHLSRTPQTSRDRHRGVGPGTGSPVLVAGKDR